MVFMRISDNHLLTNNSYAGADSGFQGWREGGQINLKDESFRKKYQRYINYKGDEGTSPGKILKEAGFVNSGGEVRIIIRILAFSTPASA